MNAKRLERWIPIRVAGFDEIPFVDWYYIGDARIDGSNLADIISLTMARPFNDLFCKRTPLEALGEYVDAKPAAAPAGFIFHMSRCGSTLVSRMLATIADTFVVSEAAAVENVLRAHLKNPAIDEGARAKWLGWIVRAIGTADPHRKPYVLKLDAWQISDRAIFERVFPGVPWIFVYRDPVEVMVSHMRGASYMMSAANAPALLDVRVEDAIRIPPLRYREMALSHILEAALSSGVTAKHLIEYSELPGVVSAGIASLFGLTPTPGDLAAMRATATIDAKHTGRAFHPDHSAKLEKATAELRETCSARLEPLYAALERLRLG